MIIYNNVGNKFWNVSLYTTKEHINCSSIAKSLNYNGGGHSNAAGCQLTTNELIKYFL